MLMACCWQRRPKPPALEPSSAEPLSSLPPSPPSRPLSVFGICEGVLGFCRVNSFLRQGQAACGDFKGLRPTPVPFPPFKAFGEGGGQGCTASGYKWWKACSELPAAHRKYTRQTKAGGNIWCAWQFFFLCAGTLKSGIGFCICIQPQVSAAVIPTLFTCVEVRPSVLKAISTVPGKV